MSTICVDHNILVQINVCLVNVLLLIAGFALCPNMGWVKVSMPWDFADSSITPRRTECILRATSNEVSRLKCGSQYFCILINCSTFETVILVECFSFLSFRILILFFQQISQLKSWFNAHIIMRYSTYVHGFKISPSFYTTHYSLRNDFCAQLVMVDIVSSEISRLFELTLTHLNDNQSPCEINCRFIDKTV